MKSKFITTKKLRLPTPKKAVKTAIAIGVIGGSIVLTKKLLEVN